MGIRAQAKAVGAKTYNTGKPCAQGHTGDRITSNANCIECGREACRRWAAKNDRTAQYKAYRATTVEARAAYDAAYRAKNAETVKAWAADWNAKNKERRREYAKETAHKRRAAKRSVRNDLTRNEIRELIKAQGGKCAYCKCKGPLTLDHIIALSRGGGNTRTNAQMLCLPCNLSKGAKHPIEFAQSRGLLL